RGQPGGCRPAAHRRRGDQAERSELARHDLSELGHRARARSRAYRRVTATPVMAGASISALWIGCILAAFRRFAMSRRQLFFLGLVLTAAVIFATFRTR